MRFKAIPDRRRYLLRLLRHRPFRKPPPIRYDATPDDVWSVISGPGMWSWLPTPCDAGRRTRLNWSLAAHPRYVGRLPTRCLVTLLKPAFHFALGALPRELPMR